jgi:hypothetical protein
MSSDPFHSAPPDPASSPFAPTREPLSGQAPGLPPAAELRPVEPVAVRRRAGGGGMLLNLLLGIALVVAVGGVAFAVGRATAPAATTTGRTGLGGVGAFGPNASGAPGRGGQGFGGAGAFGGTFSIQGTVEAMNANSITIKTANGASITLGLNSDTSYHKQAAATATDVAAGSTVIVQVDGRGAFGGGPRPNASGAPGASGAPTTGLGTAGSVTVVPAGG